MSVTRETLLARAAEAEARAESLCNPDKQQAYRNLAQALREMASKTVAADFPDLAGEGIEALAERMLGTDPQPD